MPKIIRILEMLESLVTNKEKEAAEISTLNESLQQLQMESKLKDEKQQEVIFCEACVQLLLLWKCLRHFEESKWSLKIVQRSHNLL